MQPCSAGEDLGCLELLASNGDAPTPELRPRFPKAFVVCICSGVAVMTATIFLTLSVSPADHATGPAGKNGSTAPLELHELDASEDGMPCGGPCKDPEYTCVEKADMSYSQCIDCREEGNYKYDCASYDNELRSAAVKACGLPCDNNPPRPPCHLQNRLETDYSVEECKEEEDRSVRLRCRQHNAQHCGTRLSSHGQTGVGVYSVEIQAAYGPGVATNFYLDTRGHVRSKKIPFNEIKFEVLGDMCGDGRSRIMTAFSLPGGAALRSTVPQHKEFHDVQFDACDDWHKYEILVTQRSVRWKVDGKLLREEDFTGSAEMLRDIQKGRLETHIGLWGQSSNHDFNEKMGYLTDNEEDFPLYAWFANIHLPESAEEDGRPAAYKWVYNPASSE